MMQFFRKLLRWPCANSIRRILREFQVGQPDAANKHLIGANPCWRVEACRSSCSHVIILVNAVATDAESAHEYPITIERHRTRKKHDSTLIESCRLETLRAGIGDVSLVEIEERSGAAAVNSRRIKRLGAKSNGAVGDSGARGDFGQIRSRPRAAVEVHHVSRLGCGHINAENSSIHHAIEADDRAVKI